ncbi:MAG: ATP-binding protein, partial [Promethearchaeota archaeon]
DNEDKIISLQLATRDIIERKRSEQKLRESEKRLREQNVELKMLDEIKNDFITMAAHELKTPLISISGYTEYILTKYKEELGEITPEINKDLMIVQRNIKRLQNLMDQLLDVMKIESNKIELFKHPMNVKKIINNCIDELSYIIQEKNHNLVLNVDEEITLNVDSERFFEIISNLLSNAVKFTPKKGKIEISCDQRDDGTYLFKVKDTGIGLKTDELGKLFHKFQMVREYSGENYIKGTGIGLFISKGFVEAHGGKIWATSDGHNEGTTFSFTIPY